MDTHAKLEEIRRGYLENVCDVARQLDSMADRLRAKVLPGHVDYISKARASDWAYTLARELHAIVNDRTPKEVLDAIVQGEEIEGLRHLKS